MWTEFWSNLNFETKLLDSLIWGFRAKNSVLEIHDLEKKQFWELNNYEITGLRNDQESMKKGSTGLHISVPYFSMSAPHPLTKTNSISHLQDTVATQWLDSDKSCHHYC